MSDKDSQQESNVTEFPNAETAKANKPEHSQQTEQTETGGAEKKTPAISIYSENDPEIKKMLAEYRLRSEIEAEIQGKARHKRAEEFRRTMSTFSVILTVFMILIFVSMGNPSIYKIEEDTLIVVNQALNAIILLVVPFLLGIVGASARMLIASVKPEHKGSLLVSSGLMATFSWVGIKSGVLIAIIAPHLEKASLSPERTINSAHDFYTMAFVAILVGMFSTNLYLIVSEKVEQITQQVQNKKASEKKNKKSESVTPS